jgi:hypothetical protein
MLSAVGVGESLGSGSHPEQMPDAPIPSMQVFNQNAATTLFQQKSQADLYISLTDKRGCVPSLG